MALRYPWSPVLLLLACLAGAACSDVPKHIRHTRVGQEFYVTLPLIAGNGSEWKWDQAPSFRVRTLNRSDTQSLGLGADAPGGESAQVDEVVGTVPGSFVLHWKLLLHPWELRPQVIGRYEETVIVESR